jgi:hypothetical protein
LEKVWNFQENKAQENNHEEDENFSKLNNKYVHRLRRINSKGLNNKFGRKYYLIIYLIYIFIYIYK